MNKTRLSHLRFNINRNPSRKVKLIKKDIKPSQYHPLFGFIIRFEWFIYSLCECVGGDGTLKASGEHFAIYNRFAYTPCCNYKRIHTPLFPETQYKNTRLFLLLIVYHSGKLFIQRNSLARDREKEKKKKRQTDRQRQIAQFD